MITKINAMSKVIKLHLHAFVVLIWTTSTKTNCDWLDLVAGHKLSLATASATATATVTATATGDGDGDGDDGEPTTRYNTSLRTGKAKQSRGQV